VPAVEPGRITQPDKSEGCSPVSEAGQSDFARLGRLTTLLPRFDPSMVCHRNKMTRTRSGFAAQPSIRA
jgi:hypothetical protein